MKRIKYLIAIVLLISFVIPAQTAPALAGSFAGVSVESEAKMPTASKLLSVLEKYDPDGYLFLKSSYDSGFDILTWYDEGDGLLDSMDDTVHEFCHLYTDNRYDFEKKTWQYLYHVDTGKDMTVDYDAHMMVFTNEMAQNIPTELRIRYDTYIGDSAGYYTDANQHGVYGLLNEFNAYGWGLNSDLCMYRYILDTTTKKKALFYLENHGYQNIQAYYEYKMWFYMYMEHARVNYPDLYAYLGNNSEFISAYKTVEARFAKAVKKYKKLVGSYGDGVYRKKVLKEINSDKYKEVAAVLNGGGVDTSKYGYEGDIEWTSINWLEFTDDGIKLDWRSSNGADGYMVYRKAAKGGFKKIADTEKLAYTDMSVTGGKTYQYYVVPYKKEADGTLTEGPMSVIRKKMLLGDVVIKKAVYKKGKIRITWEKPTDKRIEGYEVDVIVKKGKNETIVDGDTVTTISEKTETSTYEVDDAGTLFFEADPEYGSVKYTVRVRGYYNSKDGVIYSKWSKELTVKVG